jgi:hypothetical protein
VENYREFPQLKEIFLLKIFSWKDVKNASNAEA